MPDEIKQLIEDQGRAFEEFKKQNDTRIKQIETKGSADAVVVANVESLNAKISEITVKMKEIEKKANRPGIGDQGEKDRDVAEHKTAFFDGFMRKGRTDNLIELEEKAVNIGVPGDGGYAVPIQQDRDILSLMRTMSPMRGVCNVISLSTGEYKKLVNKHGAGHGWVGETDARPETNTPGLGELSPYWGELYANPAATQRSLDDMFFDVETWLKSEAADDFAEDEGNGFTNGDGVKKPRGFLDYPSAAVSDKAGTRPFGTLEHIAAASATAIDSDGLLDLIYHTRKGMRASARWMMNSLSVAAVRKLKNSNNDYIWQPSLAAGQPSTLHGFGIEENEDMPDIATGVVPIAFGNWKRGYTIVDRIGIRTLRDPFTNKPFVHFYMTKRVGGFVSDSEAIKLYLMA